MQVYSIEVSGKSKKLKKKNIPVSLIHCQSFAETEFCMSKNCFTIQNEKKTFNMIKKTILNKKLHKCGCVAQSPPRHDRYGEGMEPPSSSHWQKNKEDKIKELVGRSVNEKNKNERTNGAFFLLNVEIFRFFVCWPVPPFNKKKLITIFYLEHKVW